MASVIYAIFKISIQSFDSSTELDLFCFAILDRYVMLRYVVL